MWVAASQVISGATAPTREIDLTTTDLTAPSPRSANPVVVADLNGLGIALEDSLESFLNRLGRSPASTFSVTETPIAGSPIAGIPVPTAAATTGTTASTTTLASTTSTPSATTTTQRVATTAPPATTAAPATTAPPTTTPPVTTAPPTTAPPTTAPPATTAAPAGNFNSSAEADFLGRINGLRSSKGLAGLASNADLNNYARWWAKHMADTGNFAHSDIGSLLDPWSIVGENIAYGGSVAAMFNGLSNSPGHYNNMVESRFTNVGVGVYVDPSGRLWTAHVFAG